MWFLRRMQGISYTEPVTNVEVIRRANTTRKLISKKVNRKVKVYGHVMRKEEMENLVTTGYVEGKRARGRQRETYLTYLQKMKEKTPIELIYLTRYRGVWSELSNSSLRQHVIKGWCVIVTHAGIRGSACFASTSLTLYIS